MKIFISYSSKTKPIVSELADDLIASGYTVWFDRELTGGRQWWADILQQIRDCDLFIFALTQQSLDSLPCQREFIYADLLNKRVLPVQMDEITVSILPKPLQRIHFVDYRLSDKKQLAGLNKALNNLPPSLPAPTWKVIEPLAPLSPLAELRERIDAPNLTIDVQKVLAYDLSIAYRDTSIRRDVQELVKILLRREDELSVRIYNDLIDILKGVFSRSTVKNIEWQRLNFSHKKQVLSIDMSLADQSIVTATASGLITIWDSISGNEIQHFRGHNGSIFSVKFSPDGDTILSGGNDNTLRLWEISSGREIRQFTGHTGTVLSVAFSPNNQTIISGSTDATLRLWEISSEREIQQFEGHLGAITSIAFSRDGHRIISGGRDGMLHLWEVSTGRKIPHFERYGHSIESIAFSSENHYVVSANADHRLCLWEMAHGRIIRQFKGHTDLVSSVAISPNNLSIVSGGRDETLRLWELNSGREIYKFEEHEGWVKNVLFSSDGRAILSSSNDGTGRLWPLDGII